VIENTTLVITSVDKAQRNDELCYVYNSQPSASLILFSYGYLINATKNEGAHITVNKAEVADQFLEMLPPAKRYVQHWLC
jgi:hypothetical protein